MGKRINRFFTLIIKGTAVLLLLSLITALCSPFINPYYYWIAGLLGLAYQVIWSATLINTLLLVRYRKWFFTLLIFILIGTPMMLRHFSLPLKQAKNSQSKSYSIISYNVNGFSGTVHGQYNYNRQMQVDDFLNNQHPAVVCMQEYVKKKHQNVWYNNYLSSGLNLPYKQFSSFDTHTRGASNSFLTSSVFPIRKESVIYTVETELCGIFTDIEFPEGIVRVYNIHLQSVMLLKERQLLRPDRNLPAKKNIYNYIKITILKLRTALRIRSYQAIAIAESIRKSPYPVIVAGDFNDTPASFSYRVIKDGLNDAAFLQGTGFHRTYAESLYPIRIDQILISEKLRVNRYKRYKVWLSDHFPVSASFSFK